MTLNFKTFILTGPLLATLALSACAGAPPTDPQRDPIEGYNRAIFKGNDFVDRNAIEPVARGYHDYVPEGARTGVRNFLHNLRAPLNFVNNVLQGNAKGAGTDVARFGINTVVGVGGLFDVAGANGLKYQPEDFGQTLGVWGVHQGPYFVLPLLGPSTVRDTTGLIVDSFADPVNIYLFYGDPNVEWLAYVRTAVTGLDTREQLLGVIDDLRRNSFDYYAATRSAYFQERQAMVENRENGKSSAPSVSIPDYSAAHP